MKKIKFLILALLGIAIIPTATNALNTTNYTKVYRQCLGRGDNWMLDKTYPRIYCADTSYTSANIFIPYGANGLSSFKANRNLYWNGSYYNSSVYSKGQVLDTVGYFYFGYDKNPQKEKIDVSEFTINLPKNGLVNFFRFGKSRDYTDFLPNRFGLTLLDTTVVSDWKVATSVGGTMLYGKYIAYENNKLVVYDFENKIRYVRGKINNLEVDHIHGGYAVLRAIQNQKPEEVYRVEFASSNAAGYIPVFSESWQSDLVYGYKMVEILESKMVSEYDSNPQIGGGNSENPQENYNQCSSYWSDVKNLAYYSQKCGDDASDDQTQNRVKVDSWNAEGNLPEFAEGANKNKCGRFANAKKKYKEKYKENWEKFYADFGTYARTPEGVNVEVLCKGVELEHGAAFDWFKNNDNVKQRGEVLSGMIKGNKSMAEALQDDRRIIIKGTGENAITRGDYLDDTRYLRDLLSQCRGLKFRGLYTGELVQDSQYYCSLYEIQKQTLIAKYAGVDFQSHNLTSLEKFITRIENIANQGLVSHSVDELKKMGTNILSDLGNQLYSYVQDPYMSGFHQVSFIQCNNSFRVEAFDIIMYILFAAFIFLLFKYL